MKQRCKKCGQWISGKLLEETFDDNTLERAASQIKLGGLGKILDNIVNAPLKIVGAGLDCFIYHFTCPYCKNEWVDLISNENKQNEIVKTCIQKTYEYLNSTKQEEKSFFLNEMYNICSQLTYAEHLAKLYSTIAFFQYKSLNNANKALDALAESLKLMDDPNTHALKGIVMGKGRTSVDKYKVLQELVRYDENTPSNFFTPSEIKQHLEAQEQEYVVNFMTIPYNQRKFLVFDSELRVLPNSFKVLSINNCPTELQFTEGHPIEKQIYICHPHNTKFYLPIDDYQLELFYDEIKELCVLLQGLGARRVEIRDTRESEEQSQQKRSLEAKAGGEYKGYGANVGGSLGYENEEYLKVRKELCRIQEFSLGSTMPCVPEGLVWYNHRVDWQRIANQRLNGQNSHHDYLSSLKSSMVTDMEKKTLEADFNILVAKGNASAKIQKNKLFKENINATWELDVEFYPLEAYKQRQEEENLKLQLIKEEEDKKNRFLKGKGNIILGSIIIILFIVIIILLL